MSKSNQNNGNDKVVGVFLDEGHAQQAIQALQGAGYQARIADQSAIKSFRSLGWEDEIVALYEGRFNEGNSIVVAEAADGTAALGTMLENGAEYINLKEAGGNAGSTQGKGYDANYYRKLQAQQRQYGKYDQKMGRARNAEEMKLQLRDETLTPVKQAQEAGEVQLRKVVHEEQVNIPVTLKREEVFIERTPVDREVSASDANITMDADQVIKVPVYEETVELQKQTRVREEVTLGKRAVEEQQTLSGTTRHEHAELDQSGNVKVRGTNEEIVESDRSYNRQDQSTQDNTQA